MPDMKRLFLATNYGTNLLPSRDIIRVYAGEQTRSDECGCSQDRIHIGRLHFLPARRYASAGLCDRDVSVRPSVCLSVRRAPVLCLAERKQDREMYTV